MVPKENIDNNPPNRVEPEAGVLHHRLLVVQANLQRKKLATEELLFEAGKRNIAFALVQEPYVGNKDELRQYPGTRVVQKTQNRTKPVKSAIMVFDDDLEVIEDPTLTTENIAVATLRTNMWTLGVISIYLEDSLPIEPYLDHIRHIHGTLQVEKIILGGDGNAWNTWWGSVEEDRRGEELLGTLNQLNMHVLNEGTEPTFFTIRGGKIFQSHVDVTACSEAMLGRVQGWRVDKGMTSSDHNALTFSLIMEKPTQARDRGTTRKYNTKKADWEKIKKALGKSFVDRNLNEEIIKQIDTKGQLEEIVSEYIESVEKACEMTIPKLKGKGKIHLPWMTEELEHLKREVVTFKRRIPNATPRRRPHVVQEYLKIKEKYEEESKKPSE